MDLGIKRSADDLIIFCIGWWSSAGIDIVEGQALGVRHCMILPGFVLDVIQGTFQNPVSGPRGVGCFHDHIGNLEHLRVSDSGTAVSSKVLSLSCAKYKEGHYLRVDLGFCFITQLYSAEVILVLHAHI